MKPTNTYVLLGAEDSINNYINGEITSDNFEDYSDLRLKVFTPLDKIADVIYECDGCAYAILTEQEYIDFGGYIERSEATNEEMLIELIMNLHTIEVALLRERIVAMMEITKQAIEEGGEGFDTPFTRKQDYINLHDKVQQYIGLK